MRKKLTGKRLIAVFLAVLMALTCFTALPFAASAATPATSAGGKYVFAYFTGNNTSEQKIRFAVSTTATTLLPSTATSLLQSRLPAPAVPVTHICSVVRTATSIW